MILNDIINSIYARRVDWEEDKFMAQKKEGVWYILGYGAPITNENEIKKRGLALSSDKWAPCDVFGDFINKEDVVNP